MTFDPRPSTPAPLPRRTLLAGGLAGAAALLAGCASSAAAPGTSAAPGASAKPASGASPAAGGPASPAATATGATPGATASGLVARASVPVLCWHQVREQRSTDSKNSRYELVIPPANFAAQLDAIKAAGYTTITPEQYRAHIADGAALPDKPVLLSFDDGADNQATTALPMVLERGMTAAWFIMTVVIDSPQKGWTTSAQITDLAARGITIGSHTWDHHTVDKLSTAKDYQVQFVESRRTLQKLSGQDVTAFCYPGGRWAKSALPHLADAGYTMAFQLRDTPVDPQAPLMTLRRQIVVSEWTGAHLVARIGELAASPNA